VLGALLAACGPSGTAAERSPRSPAATATAVASTNASTVSPTNSSSRGAAVADPSGDRSPASSQVTPRPAPTTTTPGPFDLGFTVPADGFATFGTAGAEVFGVDGATLGRIPGALPAPAQDAVTALRFARDGHLWQARPGTTTAEPSGPANPAPPSGWTTEARGTTGVAPCDTHPERPGIRRCGSILELGPMRLAVPAPPGGVWLDAFASADGQRLAATASGPCDVAFGFVATVARGGLVPIRSTTDGGGVTRPEPSQPLAWLDDGRLAWMHGATCDDAPLTTVFLTEPSGLVRPWFDPDGPFALW
jgi:hypothetical protein